MNGAANHRALERTLDTLDTDEACPGRKKQVKLVLSLLSIKPNLDMSHPVVVEVGASGEAFATGLALVRLLTSVNTSMGVQRGAG